MTGGQSFWRRDKAVNSGLRPLPSAGGTVAAPPVADDGKRPVVALRAVSKTYTMGEVEVLALRHVSLTIEQGDFVAVMGASGSGKSTMMNIIGCLDVPTRGRYWLDGVDVRELDESDLSRVRNRKIGFIFQNYNLVPRTTALANVELALAYGGVKPKERRSQAMAALRQVGLEDRSHHLPSEMSGGQQQTRRDCSGPRDEPRADPRRRANRQPGHLIEQ